MKATNNRVVTVRLSTEDVRHLSEIGALTNRTRSDVLRGMISMTRSGGPGEDNIFLMRYVASLLTALVRKLSTSNPDDAEMMINTARLKARKELQI